MRADRRSVRRRISRFLDGDEAAVLEPAGLAAARRLTAEGAAAGADLAAYHWCRYLALPEGEDGPDFLAACQQYLRLFPRPPDPCPLALCPPDLRRTSGPNGHASPGPHWPR